MLSCANSWIYSNMKRNFANVKDTTIIEIRGTLENHEGLWQLTRDFGKRDFGNSGSVLEILEGLWQLKTCFGKVGRVVAIRTCYGNLGSDMARTCFGNLRGGLEI